MTTLFFWACVIFTPAVLIHLILLRLIRGQRFILSGYAVLVVVLLVSVPFVLSRGFLSAFCVYLWLVILWNLYLIFFINLTNSVSLRIMFEISKSRTKALSFQEIMGIYSDDETFRARVVGLEVGGFIVLQGQTMTLTSKGNQFARLLGLFRTVFSITDFG